MPTPDFIYAYCIRLNYSIFIFFQLFADVTWRPPPSQHIRFNSRGALPPVLAPSTLSFQYSDEDMQKELTADFNTEDLYYSVKADKRTDSISVALSTPHEGYR